VFLRLKEIALGILLKAYVTYVRPMLEYDSPVWSPALKNIVIESVQRRYTKRIPRLATMT